MISYTLVAAANKRTSPFPSSFVFTCPPPLPTTLAYLSFVDALLTIDLDARLNDETIRSDPFFQSLDLESVAAQTSTPPYVPASVS